VQGVASSNLAVPTNTYAILFTADGPIGGPISIATIRGV